MMKNIMSIKMMVIQRMTKKKKRKKKRKRMVDLTPRILQHQPMTL